MRSFVMRASTSIGLIVVVGLAAFAAGFSAGQEKKSSRVYELRTYTTLPGRLPALNKRFADHTMKLFEKHGMKNEMYWTPLDDEHKDNTLIYVVSHDSRDAADKSWKEFGADPEWQKVAAESQTEANGGKIVSKVDRVWMKLTDYSPVK